MLLIAAFFPIVNSTMITDKGEQQLIDVDTSNLVRSNNDVDIRDEEEPCYECEHPSMFTIIDHKQADLFPVTEIFPIDDPKQPSPKPAIIDDLPSEFNWRYHNGGDYTTIPRDQMPCGSCWLFGAMSTLEAIIEVREDCPELNPDLSEQYVMSCLPASPGMYGRACRGGSPQNVFRYILDNGTRGNDVNGIIPEACFGYMGIDMQGLDYTHSGFDKVECDEKCSDWEDYIIPITDYGYWYPNGSEEDLLAIKSQIYETGPVTTCYFSNANFSRWVSSHHDEDDYFPYEYATGSNHCISICGWKDDPSIEKGGYWIIKNSWGPYTGYDGGYFNIEYGSLNMNSYIVWVDYDPVLYDWPPQADIGGPYDGIVGETITFDAGNCVDPEDEIVSYEWDFGDGSTGSGVTTTHSYDDSGLYTVTLTIMNDKGDVAVDTGSVTIEYWEEGDYWIYDMDEFDIYMKILDYNMVFDVDLSSDDLRLAYDSETDTSYILSFEGPLDGYLNFEIDVLKPGLRLAKNGLISGTMTLQKGTLALEEVEYTISGSINVKWGNLPLPIPLPMSITLSSDFYSPFKFYDFPLEEGKMWTSQSNYVETSVSTESSGFNILRLVNTIGTPIMGFPVIPEESILQITLRSDRYSCEGSETINVPAGTYEAQQIDFANLVDYYFSEDVNNVVKMTANTGAQSSPLWDLQFNINAELVETNQ